MRRWPLRWTIPAIAVTLVVLTELIIGSVVIVLLERTLRDQVDTKLENTAHTLADRPGMLMRPGMGQQVQEARVPNDVLVAVYSEDGSLAAEVTERLNDGRQLPALDLDPDREGTYTLREGTSAWRVTVTDAGMDQTVAVMMPLRDANRTSTVVRRSMLLVGGLSAAGAALLAALATRRSLSPLADAERTAAAIAAGDLSSRVPPAPAGTEAGSLARSLNGMLEQLTSSMRAREASEERLRRFVSDASHELRTPLAAIRGYAELSRMGADADGRAIERIEANAERMAAMVEDLLLLARYDESAASLTGSDQLDVAALAADAAADLRAQDLSREVTVITDGDCTVRGSERHLSQLLANLGGNVLAHTPPGSPVELGVRRIGGAVQVTVRDHGPGFGPGHAERAFERFYRADSSRTRDTGGSGLGLAIVAAIASAHGGGASAANASGGGAIITVTLPT